MLQYLTFAKDSEVPVALRPTLLKQAFTALSFGARKTARAWMDQKGEWARPAMVEIFRVKEERDRSDEHCARCIGSKWPNGVGQHS